MIDNEIIRDNYAHMSDGQLIRTMHEDGHHLTTAAFDILKAEFKKRNLDQSHIESAGQKKISIHQEKIQQVKNSNDDDFNKAIWKYIIEEKENRTPDKDILSGLQERGLDATTSLLMLSGLKDGIKKTIHEFDNGIWIGIAVCIIGIFVTLFTYSTALTTGGYYYVAYGALILGVVRAFSSFSKKGKYKRILKDIESQDAVGI